MPEGKQKWQQRKEGYDDFIVDDNDDDDDDDEISLLGYISLTKKRVSINISLTKFGLQGYIGCSLVVVSCPGFILSKIEFLEFLGCEAAGRT